MESLKQAIVSGGVVDVLFDVTQAAPVERMRRLRVITNAMVLCRSFTPFTTHVGEGRNKQRLLATEEINNPPHQFSHAVQIHRKPARALSAERLLRRYQSMIIEVWLQMCSLVYFFELCSIVGVQRLGPNGLLPIKKIKEVDDCWQWSLLSGVS